MRASKKRKFSGHWFERVRSNPTKSKQVAVRWAKFQRLENNLACRVVPVVGGYEIYIRRLK